VSEHRANPHRLQPPSRRRFLGHLATAGAAELPGSRPSRTTAEAEPETTKLTLALTSSGPQRILAQGTDWRLLDELEKELKG